MISLNGLLLVNKPAGITSHDLVDQARRIFRIKEVGHSGTLDPMASGLMVILLGQATKLSPYIMDGDKAYSVEIQLGARYDTLDVTGKITEKHDVTTEHISKVSTGIESLVGEFEWPVPLFSAVKVQGQKLYDIARSDKSAPVNLPLKIMKFWNLKQTSPSAESFWVDLECSKGSFIRTWVDYLGNQIGCGAAMKSLVRTKSSPFSLDQAQTLSETENCLKENRPLSNFVPMNWALPHLKKARVHNFDKTLLLNGQISHDLRRQLIGLVDPEVSSLIQAVSMREENLLALIGYEKGQGFKIKRVLASNKAPEKS